MRHINLPKIYREQDLEIIYLLPQGQRRELHRGPLGDTQVPPGAKPHFKYLQVAPVLGAKAAAAAGEGRVFHESSHQT